VIIDKFDPNLVLININKLKPYRFMEDHTLQLVLVKLNDFLSKEPMEVTHFDNLSPKQQVDKTHFDNLSNE
jgi:hypothetical protein